MAKAKKPPTMAYQFRAVVPVPTKARQVGADTIGKTCERNRKKRRSSEYSARDYVADATPKMSPLHPTLEWDDKKAAKEHRLEQARTILRSIKVVYDNPESKKITHRVRVDRLYMPPEEDAEGGYRSVNEMSEQELYELRVQQAWRNLNRWIEKFDDLDEFAPVMRAAKRVLNNIRPLLDEEELERAAV
jgi:hypothetical protein